MLLFGVVCPAIIAWVTSGWLATRLTSIWGALLSILAGFFSGVFLSSIAYGVIADYILKDFDGEHWLRATATSLGVAMTFSIWSTVRVRQRGS